MSKQNDRVRKQPRISINKLGEYLTASPARRRAIIRDQKFPPHMAGRYGQAEAAIVTYLAGDRDPHRLEAIERGLRKLSPISKYEAQRANDCADAIAAFRVLVRKLDLDDVRVHAGDSRPPRLSFAGVDVSVRPELVLEQSDRGGGAQIGLLKLYFAKTHPLDPEAGGYVSAVAHQFALEHLAGRGAVHRPLVGVVDVFAGRVHGSPKAVVRRLTDVEAACQEISARWQTMARA